MRLPPSPAAVTSAAALTTIATFMVLHVAGVLTAEPIVRHAEILALLALAVYAAAAGLPVPRWPLPAALGVLVVDAVRTMPHVVSGTYSSRAWLTVDPARIDHWESFTGGMRSTWAPLAFALLLLVVAGRGTRPPRAVLVAGAVVAVAYPAARLVDIAVDLDSDQWRRGPTLAEALTTAVLAVLAPLALALAATLLAALLARYGRWIAAGGAGLLALAGLAHLDAALARVPALSFAGDDTALFAWHRITPSLALPAPVPAATAAVELAAFLLVVVGVTGRRRINGGHTGRTASRDTTT
ncbi:hypothetical protein AB0K04_08700 [Micromonospora coxensis]|uniref:hypothetical protein n=1 Tax=Micromonospora coxensis TaxID=356852 RepID=UPI003418DF58